MYGYLYYILLRTLVDICRELEYTMNDYSKEYQSGNTPYKPVPELYPNKQFRNRTSKKNLHVTVSTKKDIEDTIHHLYSLDTHGKEIPSNVRQKLNTLRQLINEEFVHNNKTIGTQTIYDILEEIL